MTEGEICIPNIGMKNRQQRRNFGILLLAVGAVIGVVMLLFSVPWWWRLLLFFPLYMGMSGIFQAREKT